MAVRSITLNLRLNFKLTTLKQIPCQTLSRETTYALRKRLFELKPSDNHGVTSIQKCALLHTSTKQYKATAVTSNVPVSSKESDKTVSQTVTENAKGLLEFFDDEKNWGTDKVKSGRSWTTDELRIKSNSDLHKLWFVLLKERNMLLTMAEAAKKEFELMPSPERLDKVEESMENLEQVVKERNRAYHLLETGETGERKVKLIRDGLGLFRRYAEIEHSIPVFMNNSFRKKYYFNGRGSAVKKFLALLREKHHGQKMHVHRLQRNHARRLLERFPDLDDEVMKERFPEVDLKKLKQTMS